MSARQVAMRVARRAALRLSWAVAFLVCVAVPAVAQDMRVLHEEKSLYRNIVVYEADSLRCLKFGRSAQDRQTCVMLKNPNQLVFEYTRMMMAMLYLNPHPGRILIIGLGGGTLPDTLAKLVPDARIDVVEIDPAVVKVARDYFGFKTGPAMQVSEEDGRVFVKHRQREGVHYDLVVLDAFNEQYIPEHMLTREFLNEVKSILTPRGVLAANTFATSGLYEHESATYDAVFGSFYALKSKNRVILVRLGNLPDRAELEANARSLEERLRMFGTGESWLLPMFEVESGWSRKARVLTDQYSPANLLNSR